VLLTPLFTPPLRIDFPDADPSLGQIAIHLCRPAVGTHKQRALV